MNDKTERRRLRVLLVDGDPTTQELLRQEFGTAGIELLVAADAEAFRRLHGRGRTDVVILDVSPGAADGMELCRQLRAEDDDTPLIMIGTKADEVDRIVGLEIGADDYLVKPFHPRELLARLHAILRRRPTPEPPGAPTRSAEIIHFGPFEFDLQRRELKKGEESLPLTTGEYAMLKALARHPHRPLTRDQLAQLARGRPFGPYDRSLDVQISRLRRVVEADPAHPRFIQTVWGVGYVFVPDGAA